MNKDINQKSNLVLLVLILFLLSACNGSSRSIGDEHERKVETNQDISSVGDEENAYPIQPLDQYEKSVAYPVEEELLFGQKAPIFTISEPVNDGDFVVTGTGPSDIPLKLINLSQVDLIIGETIISKEGTFVFQLDEPLISGHTIGIQLGDISETSLNPDDYIFSDTYYERPYVGILFDIVIVE